MNPDNPTFRTPEEESRAKQLAVFQRENLELKNEIRRLESMMESLTITHMLPAKDLAYMLVPESREEHIKSELRQRMAEAIFKSPRAKFYSRPGHQPGDTEYVLKIGIWGHS